MEKIIFVTSNAHKVEEANHIMAGKIAIISSKDTGFKEDIPETGDSFEANAKIKVEAYLKKIDRNESPIVMAEDSGLCVERLHLAPGIYSARYSGPDATDLKNNQKLLKQLKDETDRSAFYKACICLFFRGQFLFFNGTMQGNIAQEIKGEQGFGYDPIFIPQGEDMTLATLGQEWKNKNSHRYHAMKQLAMFFDKQ